jgi:23S rRNA (uracil1939-C5)-methyltransferase
VKTDLSPGDIIECTLTSLEYGGHACVRHHEAMLYMARGVPGDKVKARVKQLRKNFGSADILEILAPSSDRVAPDCPAFAAGCGGCQWLHIAYPVQLLWKQRMLGKMFSKELGTRIEPAPVVPMREPRAFRNKLSLVRDDRGRFGFMKENSKELLAIDQCPMELPLIQRLYRRLIRFPFPPPVTQLHVRGTRDECSLVMYADRVHPMLPSLARKLIRVLPGLVSVAVKTYGGLELLDGLPFVSQRVGNLEFRIPPDSFFQTNYFQALTLLDTAKKLVKPAAPDRIVDLYAGVGFFALELARIAGQVIGIEGNRQAVEAARLNTKLNKLTNATFRAASAESGLRAFQPGSVDALLLDPPRDGCEESVLREIARIRPPRIVYFSCDPDTLIRDCAWLIDQGYLLSDIVPIDMFPHTHHLETAVKLVARA